MKYRRYKICKSPKGLHVHDILENTSRIQHAYFGKHFDEWIDVIEFEAYKDLIKALRDIAKAPCASSDHSEYNCASCLAHSKLRNIDSNA